MPPVDWPPPPIPGDPAGMRALAAGLRADAGSIALVAAEVDARMSATEFIGPAADRLQHAVGGSAKDCGKLADRLITLAGILERSATEV
jgi:hypothetical protein